MRPSLSGNEGSSLLCFLDSSGLLACFEGESRLRTIPKMMTPGKVWKGVTVQVHTPGTFATQSVLTLLDLEGLLSVTVQDR